MSDIKSNKVLWTEGKNDECYTPFYAIDAILERVKSLSQNFNIVGYSLDIIDNKPIPARNLIVWCPFDTKDSEFVKRISTLENVTVIHSHIEDGKDFYTYEPDKWDIIVSNPPFTNKRKIFERALSFGKPFALLMSLTWLNDKAPKTIFGNDLQLSMFDNRLLFLNPSGEVNTKITFASAFFGYKFFSKDISINKIPTVSEQKRILS